MGKVEGTYCKKENRNSPCKDPRTFQGNSPGGHHSTPQTNSRGEDPRTFKVPVERWRVQKKWKEKRWKKKKKKNDKKQQVKYRSSLWKKVKERIARFLAAKRKEEEEEKKGRKSKNAPGQDKSWASREDCFFVMLVARNWLCVNAAAAEGLQQRTEMMDRWQNQKVQMKESKWAEEIPQRWRQPQGEDRTKNERGKAAEVHLAKRISVEHREEVHEKVQRTMRYLFGIEHRLRKGGNGGTAQ